MVVVAGCGGGSSPGGSGGGPAPVAPGAYTYTLDEGTSSLPLWTTPATRKLRAADRAPSTHGSGIAMSAARGEIEPALLVVGPGSGTFTVAVTPFAGLTGARVEVSRVVLSSGWGDGLEPISSTTAVSRSGGSGTGLWLTVRVPGDAPAGEHAGALVLTAGSERVTVPVRLHVFDFALPEEIHFKTQMNLEVSSLIPAGGTVEDAKTLLFEHRMTPTSATWPSGFSWQITWDTAASPTRCSAFYDESDQAPEYSVRALARKYLLGEGWNGVGFPDAEIAQFVNNSTPRPDTFCGVARGDAFGTAAYNTAWKAYLQALDAYLVDNGFASRTYFYVQNEPQDQADHDVAAALCRLYKAAAPHLRLAISEEPKPEIAEHASGACGYDIWIAHVRAYQEAYAQQRIAGHGEELWFYSLDHDPEPYFNPTRIDTDGINQRIIPWVSWAHRARGFAYYDAGRFFDGGRPGVRAELLREGFEDYEYLWLAAGRAHPAAGATIAVDATVRSVAASLTSFTRDADALMTLRHELGRYLEGARATLPVLTVDSGIRPRGSYHLNFQDPAGQPTAEPLVVDGKTWIKVGWQRYDESAGIGWYGENIGTSVVKYGYDDVPGFSETQRSYVYDDYGRDNLFELALAPGRYLVTVGVGRPGRAYPGDPHNVSIEGVKVVDDEATTDAAPTITRSTTVELTDGRLSVVVGGRSARTGDYAYTFLEYLDIVPSS